MLVETSQMMPITKLQKSLTQTVRNISENKETVFILKNNAMEAVMREEQDSNRFVRIFVGILKEQLYISVYNSMNGKPKKGKKNQYLSTKGGDNHGFGLSRIDYIVEKNKGFKSPTPMTNQYNRGYSTFN